MGDWRLRARPYWKHPPLRWRGCGGKLQGETRPIRQQEKSLIYRHQSVVEIQKIVDKYEVMDAG